MIIWCCFSFAYLIVWCCSLILLLLAYDFGQGEKAFSGVYFGLVDTKESGSELDEESHHHVHQLARVLGHHHHH